MIAQLNDSKKEIKEENIKIILNKLEKLKKLFDLRTGTTNNLDYYSTNKGWSQYLYKIKKDTDYTKALHLITEILDLIRGEPLILKVQKIQKDENGKVIQINDYEGKESEVDLSIRNKESEYKKEIHYQFNKLKKQVITDKAFLQHYENFEKIANEHFKYKKFNEGHIIEAYQRHLYYVQHSERYSEDIPVPHVAIMLYYSMNSTGQQKGGDILFSQIKGENTQLATQMSIIAVASKLIEIYRMPEKFDLQSFNKLFKVEIQEEMADYEKLKDYTIDQLLKEINQKKS